MTGVRLFVRASQRQPPALVELASALGDLEPFLRDSVKLRRASIDQEFRSETFFTPGGGARPWAPLKDPRGVRLGILRKTGALYRAWMGGPGSIEKIGENTATFGVSGSAFPHASVHRGSSRGNDPPARIRQRGGRVIVIPRRPHGHTTPDLRDALQRRFLRHVRERVS